MATSVYTNALQAIGCIVNMVSPAQQLSSSPKATIRSDEAQKKAVTAPMTTIVQLCLIEQVGSKVAFESNRLVIQPPGAKQSWDRTYLLHHVGLGDPPPSHNDCLAFKEIIHKAAEWYKPDENIHVATIFRLAMRGLMTLRETYSETTTKDTLSTCIIYLEKACGGELGVEEAVSASSSRPTPSTSRGSSSRASSSSASATPPVQYHHEAPGTMSFAQRVKELWNDHEIKNMALNLTRLNELKVSEDFSEQALGEKLKVVVDGLVDFKVAEFQWVINNTIFRF